MADLEWVQGVREGFAQSNCFIFIGEYEKNIVKL